MTSLYWWEPLTEGFCVSFGSSVDISVSKFADITIFINSILIFSISERVQAAVLKSDEIRKWIKEWAPVWYE